MPNSSRSPPLQNAGPAPLSSTDSMVGSASASSTASSSASRTTALNAFRRSGTLSTIDSRASSRVTSTGSAGWFGARSRAAPAPAIAVPLAEPPRELRPAQQQRVGGRLGRQSLAGPSTAVCRTSCPHATAARGDRETAVPQPINRRFQVSRDRPRPGDVLNRNDVRRGPGRPAHRRRAVGQRQRRGASQRGQAGRERAAQYPHRDRERGRDEPGRPADLLIRRPSPALEIQHDQRIGGRPVRGQIELKADPEPNPLRLPSSLPHPPSPHRWPLIADPRPRHHRRLHTITPAARDAWIGGPRL